VSGDVQIPVAFKRLFEPHRYKAFYGGRGSAKSHSIAKALLLQGATKPLRVLCGRETQNSIKDSVKALLDDQIALLGLEHLYISMNAEIRGANGTLFIFSGLGQLTVDQIKSFEGVDICWIEEAQTISSRSLEVLIPTIRKDGSEIWLSWNPRSASDPVDMRFRGESPPEDAVIQRVSYRDNPFFPLVLEKERLYDKANIPDRYMHIWEGDYEPQAVGAIWSREGIMKGRIHEAPELGRIVVAVDHATSDKPGVSNEHGIVVAGRGSDGKGYVLDDLSLSGSPAEWARQAWSAYDLWDADAIVVERNQGGDLVANTLRTVRPSGRIIEVTATRGKHVRAEPIASLYQLGRVHHVGTFPELEGQMCLMTSHGYEGPGSPDRLDAMVWAMTELFPTMIHRRKKRLRDDLPQISWMS